MTKASDNVFPRFLISEGGSTATPGAAQVTVYAKADGLLYSKDDAGAETLMSGGSAGAVATDAIWDAAGDLAVGSGANTAAKLAKGNAGGVLAMGNSAVIWNAGTSFPASKATNDRYWRTDIMGGMEFFWDGTQWRSSQIFEAVPQLIVLMSTGYTANANPAIRYGFWQPTYNIFLIYMRAETYVFTTNDGTKYWTLDLVKGSDGTTVVGTVTTSADTADTATNHLATINAASTEQSLSLKLTKTSTAGNLIMWPHIGYQLIAT